MAERWWESSTGATAALANVIRPIEQQPGGLPNEAYVSDEFAAWEREALLARSWACIASGRRVPEAGDACPIEFAGVPLMMLRGHDGEVRVFHNVCSHRGMALLDKPARLRGAIRCPYHSWTYGLDGSLRSTPMIGGVGRNDCAGFERARHGLKPVRTATWLDAVFVNLSGGAPPFETFIAPVAERWRDFDGAPLHHEKRDSSFVLDVACNWKLAVENFCEAYHLPWIHPSLNSYSRIEDHYGSISETYAWSCRRGLKAGSRRWLLAEFHEMEPPQIAVQVLGGDAPEAAQEALDLAVAAVDRLDVHGPPDALAGGGVDALVTDIERRRDGRIATVGVGDQQRVRGEDRLQHLSDVVCVQRRQGMAEGRAGPVGGDQDRHLLAREAALAGLAAASARLAIQLPLPLAALENEGLIRLHDPGKPIRRLAHRREKAVAPAMRRARRNPAARGRRLDRLALGKRGAEGKPALLVVQPGQRRPRERSKGLPAALAPKPAQTARLAPRHRTAGAAMRAAPLLVDTQLDCRQRGRALRRVGQHRCNLLALRRRQLVDTRKPLPKALVIHLSDPKGKPETILSQCIQITN